MLEQSKSGGGGGIVGKDVLYANITIDNSPYGQIKQFLHAFGGHFLDVTLDQVVKDAYEAGRQAPFDEFNSK